MIFDFDDAVFVAYVSPSNGYLSYLKFPAKTKTICRLATHVIAGNTYLADYARQTNDNVSIVPTTIDTDKYEVLPRKENEVPVIGWSGSFSTVQHLDSLASALRRLAQKENFRLLVIGTPVYKIDGVDVEALPWRSATEVSDLRQIDIGIMPLPDEPWSRGKCGLKALQYMALGIPTVCSPVGVNSEIIQDSFNGFLAGTEDEWVAKLTQLLNDSKLRARLGAPAARQWKRNTRQRFRRREFTRSSTPSWLTPRGEKHQPSLRKRVSAERTSREYEYSGNRRRRLYRFPPG